jgi:hypothetical protein
MNEITGKEFQPSGKYYKQDRAAEDQPRSYVGHFAGDMNRDSGGANGTSTGGRRLVFAALKAFSALRLNVTRVQRD